MSCQNREVAVMMLIIAIVMPKVFPTPQSL